jgi:hypothetical protein
VKNVIIKKTKDNNAKLFSNQAGDCCKVNKQTKIDDLLVRADASLFIVIGNRK